MVNSRFIEKFGTHIIVGVKMGGKDVIYLKQQHSSNLQPAEVQKRLKEMADKRFRDTNGQFGDAGEVYDKGKVCDALLLCMIYDFFVISSKNHELHKSMMPFTVHYFVTLTERLPYFLSLESRSNGLGLLIPAHQALTHTRR